MHLKITWTARLYQGKTDGHAWITWNSLAIYHVHVIVLNLKSSYDKGCKYFDLVYTCISCFPACTTLN